MGVLAALPGRSLGRGDVAALSLGCRVEARGLKVLEGRVDAEPSAELMLRAKGEGRTCMPKHLGMLMRVGTAYGVFHALSTQSLRGH